MNITFPILTCSRIARSFKIYHRFEHQTQETKSTIHLSSIINLSIFLKNRSTNYCKKKKLSQFFSPRLPYPVFPFFLGERPRKGKASCIVLRVKNRDENPRFPVRLRALPTRMHTSSAGARASTPHARNHALTRPSVSPRAQRRYYLIISITGR